MPQMYVVISVAPLFKDLNLISITTVCLSLLIHLVLPVQPQHSPKFLVLTKNKSFVPRTWGNIARAFQHICQFIFHDASPIDNPLYRNCDFDSHFTPLSTYTMLPLHWLSATAKADIPLLTKDDLTYSSQIRGD